MSRRLVLRADAGHRLGSGHVMRLLALAEAARARGDQVGFVLGGEPEPSARLVRARGFEARELLTEPGALDDLAGTLAEARGADAIVVDGPGLDAGYLEALAPAVGRVAALDDLGARRLPCEVVVNHNLGAEQLAGRYPGARQRLLGRRYALLRPEFRALPRGGAPVDDRATRVLITMGGSDPAGATARVVAAVPGAGLTLAVVLGAACRCDAALTDALARAEQRGHRIELHYAPATLPALMAGCDLAVSAGGGTLGELAYLGRPTIGIAIADDQRANVARHAEAGVIAAGLSLDGPGVPGLNDAIAALVADPSARRHLRERASDLVDGEGAARVVAELAA